RSTGATVRPAGYDGFYRATWPIAGDPPWVSILIPANAKPALLETAVESILRKTRYRHFRLVIINNGSETHETKACLSRLSPGRNVSVLDCPPAFSSAAMKNWAVRHVETPLVALVDNDVEVVAA